MHMLTGQLNIVPRFGTINGKIVFDGTITPPFGKVPSQPVVLTVENSKIVKFEGGPEAAEYEKYLKSFDDEGMFKMAHIAYGFNPGAKLTGNVVEDEKSLGMHRMGHRLCQPDRRAACRPGCKVPHRRYLFKLNSMAGRQADYGRRRSRRCGAGRTFTSEIRFAFVSVRQNGAKVFNLPCAVFLPLKEAFISHNYSCITCKSSGTYNAPLK